MFTWMERNATQPWTTLLNVHQTNVNKIKQNANTSRSTITNLFYFKIKERLINSHIVHVGPLYVPLQLQVKLFVPSTHSP